MAGAAARPNHVSTPTPKEEMARPRSKEPSASRHMSRISRAWGDDLSVSVRVSISVCRSLSLYLSLLILSLCLRAKPRAGVGAHQVSFDTSIWKIGPCLWSFELSKSLVRSRQATTLAHALTLNCQQLAFNLCDLTLIQPGLPATACRPAGYSPSPFGGSEWGSVEDSVSAHGTARNGKQHAIST